MFTMPSSPFTAVLCAADGCCRDTGLDVTGALRATTRRCPHGVLVLAGCVLGPVLCLTCGPSGDGPPGSYVVVQPCAHDRRPTGSAVRVGPLRTAADVAALSDWLEHGDLRRERLPQHLRAVPGALRSASLN